MKNSKDKILLIGIGNSGRGDDGLGWAFLDAVQQEKNLEAELIYKYQLNIEDAELISNADKVLFIDADNRKWENGYNMEKCKPKDSFEFTTHALSPGVIIALSQNLYDHVPEAYVLSIEGEEWELREGLGSNAKQNLKKALEFFKNSTFLKEKGLSSIDI